MLSDNASSWKHQMRFNMTQAVHVGPRRAHGGTAWGARPEYEMRQPQDGGIDSDVRSRVAEINAHLNRPAFAEPEDARITGTTRSLMRRLMGLNVTSRKAPKVASALLKEPRVA